MGALLYCAVNTRHDVAYATGMLCRCMACPDQPLLSAALRVLAYLHSSKDIGLRYSPVSDDLVGYSDSDWGERRSTSGSVFTFGNAAISWGSSKQTCVALSSCEAEIMAASEAAKDAVYLSNFLKELGLTSPSQIASLAVDNTAAIDLAYNPQHHKRTKHIERRHYFVRECVEEMKLIQSNSLFVMRDTIMNVPHAPSADRES